MPQCSCIRAWKLCCPALQVPKPKMEVGVPYQDYKLVRADGSAVERVKKHPFCMSRIYYDAAGTLCHPIPFVICTGLSPIVCSMTQHLPV